MNKSHRSWFAAALVGAAFTLSASAPAQVLVDGYPPLTQKTVDQMIQVQELLLTAKMKPEQRARMKSILIEEWQKGDPSTISGVEQITSALPQLMALPDRTRTLAIRSNLLGFLVQLEKDAAGGEAYSSLLLQVYKDNHKPIHPNAPLFSPLVADAYVDAFLFLGEVQSGKPAPKLSAESRKKLQTELAGDYVRMNDAQRDQMTQSMIKVVGYQIQWPQMQDWERLLVRADLGAPLSMEERQLAQQLRHQVQSHSLQMLTSELNHMRNNQQMIMGSAPYWNPTTQAWEQKGGIVTEFR